MSTLQSTAISKAIAFLTAAGAKFAIVAADGQKFGTLEVAPERPAGMRRRVFSHLPKHDWIAKLNAAARGQTLTFECDSAGEAKSLQGSISSKMGGDNALTTVRQRDEKFVVECLVVNPLSEPAQAPAPAPQLGLPA